MAHEPDLPVPFYNMPARVAPYRDQVMAAVEVGVSSERPILGPEVEAFERALGTYVGIPHVVGTSCGTAALLLAFRSLGVGPGTTVVTSALSFHSSVSSAIKLGAQVRFVDVRVDDAAMDTTGLADGLVGTGPTVIAPAHIFSAMCDMAAIRAVAAPGGIPIVEDAAVAIGMARDGVMAGAAGTIGTFSFQPVKMLPALGDAGAIVTADAGLADRLRRLRNHGQPPGQRFTHVEVGWNARMDEVNGHYLRHRLATHDRCLAARSRIAARYHDAFAPFGELLALPPAVPYRRAFYTYVVRCPHRDELRQHLRRHGVETRVYYPQPLHRQPAFARLGVPEGRYPVAERWSREALALPLYPEMPDSHVEQVVEGVRAFADAVVKARPA
jgi:dTDP-4-amino-4,6-dideoxygalactose transaminase